MLSPFLVLSLGVVVSNPDQVIDAADDNHGPVAVKPANLDFRLHGHWTRMAMSAAQTIESISTITPSITESLRTMRFFIAARINEAGVEAGHNSEALLGRTYIGGCAALYAGTYKSMRHLHLVLTDIVRHLGGTTEVAKLCVVQRITTCKWLEDPAKSGQVIPLVHLQTVLAETKKHLENIPLQAVVSELLNDHFAALCGRLVMLQEKVAEIIYALQDGYKPVVKIRGEGGLSA